MQFILLICCFRLMRMQIRARRDYYNDIDSGINLKEKDMKTWSIPSLDKNIGEEVSAYLDTLTKPMGSLGKLEDLAVKIAELTGQKFPDIKPPAAIVFAADHGITAEGASAFPKEVTDAMVTNFLEVLSAMDVF